MGILKELDAVMALTDRERRQLRLSGVHTAADLFAFYHAYPELVEGRKQASLTADVTRSKLATWGRDLQSKWSSPRISTHFTAAVPADLKQLEAASGPGALPDDGDVSLRRYLDVLEFAWKRVPLAFRARAAAPLPPSPATGALVPGRSRLQAGSSVPFSVLRSRLSRLSSPDPAIQLDLAVSLDEISLKVVLSGTGRARTPVAAPPGTGGDPWEDLIVALDPLGGAVARDHDPWDCRDQQDRGTCTAFAVAASAEHIDTARDDLSEESLFGANAAGADASTLAAMGTGAPILLEADQAYHAPPPPAHQATHPRRFSSVHVDMPTAAEVYAELAAGRAPAVALPVWRGPVGADNWCTLSGWTYGHVLGPPAGARMVGAHAVCFVGYEPDATGGWFIFRNSWSAAWGTEVEPEGVPWHPRPGYGYIHASVVHNFALELRSVTARTA